jgi:hypothetical protein
MAAFLDLCRFIPTLGGTTDFVFSSAVGGCQSPSAAGAQNGVKYKCYAVSTDLTQWEIFEGAYNSGAGTFPRTTVLYNSSGTGTAAGQSGAGTKISFSTVPQVSVVGIAEDLPNLSTPNKFTDATEATGAGTTAAGIISGGLEVLKKLFVTGLATFRAAVSITDTTASTSTTTGAITTAGGIGAAGRGNFGGNVAAPSLTPTAAAGSAWGFDCSAVTITVPGSGSATIADGSGMLIMSDGTVTGQTGVFLVGGSLTSACVLVAGGSSYVTPTTTPASNKYSVGFDGTHYRIYNGNASAITFTIAMIRTRATV